jgi:hypothetical protein
LTAGLSFPEQARAAAKESTAITIDWGEEAARSASAMVASQDAGRKQSMGGSVSRESSGAPRKFFPWDETVTERVDLIPGGGTLIHLNDNCALTFTPLPMLGCWLGKRESNGHLFDEMSKPAAVNPFAGFALP